MAEAKRRARQRRALVALGLLLLAGAALALALALRSSGAGPPGGPPGGGLTSASYRQWGVSLRYPSGWTQLRCRAWTDQGMISLLTSARPAPTCTPPRLGFPPPENLGADGAAIFLMGSPVWPWAKIRWNARIGGQPANVPPPAYGAKYLVDQICPAGARREYRTITIKPAHAAMLNVGALICGPHFATGDAAMRTLLASMRFTKPSR
ncbi:MAG TPA: hypothetical protein VJU80_12375 [Solirubrobacteraceae bacterium]|nr:hypothetical protein [Solirubrobacteraceae bacterium]